MRKARTRNRHYTRERHAVVRGPQVYAALVQAQASLRENLNELQSAYQELEKQLETLLMQRADEFDVLSKHYLPELTDATVAESFKGVRRDLKRVIRKQKSHKDELRTAIERARQNIQQAQLETDQVTEQLNEKVEARDRLQAVVAEKLKQDQVYIKRTKEAAVAELRLSQNEERLQQVNEDASRKLPSYENSRLFKYLHDRKFGTLDYQSTGLTRRIDRWLARYIGYTKARKSYDFMTVMPGLMAADLQKRRDGFNALMNQIESLETNVEQEVGLTAVIEQGNQLGLRRDELVNQIEDYNREQKVAENELNQLQSSTGQYYQQAVEILQQHLQHTQQSVLEMQAQKSHSLQDDHVVAEIRVLNDQIDSLRPQLKNLSRQRRPLIEKQSGLDDIIRRFRSSNFDSRRSVFPDEFEMGQLVGRFLNDIVDSRGLWKTIRKNQKFQENWAQQTATDVLNNPSAQIVLHTMLDLASEALKNSARRSVYRRNSKRGSGISWPNFPSSSKRRSRSSSKKSSHHRRSKPRQRKGGFSSGDGF